MWNWLETWLDLDADSLWLLAWMLGPTVVVYTVKAVFGI